MNASRNFTHKIHSKSAPSKTAFILTYTDYIHGKTRLQIKDRINEQISIIDRFEQCDIIGVFNADSWKVLPDLPRRMIKVLNYDANSSETFSIGVGLQCTEARSVFIYNGTMPLPYEFLEKSNESYIQLVQDGQNGTKYGCNISGINLELMLPGGNNKWSGLAYLTNIEFNKLFSICSNQDKGKLLLCELINEILLDGGNIKVKGKKNVSNRK